MLLFICKGIDPHLLCFSSFIFSFIAYVVASVIGWGLPLFILETAIFFIEDGRKVLVACLIGLGTKVHIVVRKYAHNL